MRAPAPRYCPVLAFLLLSTVVCLVGRSGQSGSRCYPLCSGVATASRGTQTIPGCAPTVAIRDHTIYHPTASWASTGVQPWNGWSRNAGLSLTAMGVVVRRVPCSEASILQPVYPYLTALVGAVAEAVLRLPWCASACGSVLHIAAARGNPLQPRRGPRASWILVRRGAGGAYEVR